MADGIFYAGKPLLIHFNGLGFNVDDWLREWLPFSPAECPPKATVDERRESNRTNRTHRALPIPNYPALPPIGLNQLYWPTGALRWARGYFLADTPTATFIRNGMASQKTLTVSYGGKTLNAKMYALTPQPITSAASNRLHIIPLVDSRYFWQMSNVVDIELERGDEDSEWSDVFDAFTSWNHVEPLTVPTIAAGWLKPDPVELTRSNENIAIMMDAVAHSLGLRVVRDLNGSTKFLTPQQSANRFLSNAGTYSLLAGASRLAGPTSARASVFFQRMVAGAVDCGKEWLSGSDGAATGTSVQDVQDVIHSTAFAYFKEDDSATPENDTELSALADLITASYFGYQQATEYDNTFGGLHNWQPTGFDDFLLYTFAKERTPETRIVGNALDGDGLQLETRSQPAGPFVRVRSMPKTFGVQHQLSQDGDVVEVKEPYFRLIDHDDGTDEKNHLLPGEWAFFEYVERTDAQSDWEVTDPQLIVKIYDPNHFAFTLVGEVIKAEYSCKRHRWETTSESGLLRQVKPVSTISNQGQGDCEVYVGETLTASPKVTLSDVGVHWMFAGNDALADVDALARYFRDDETWKLINQACS